MNGLTVKQRRFADEYLLDCNATQAAIRAGYSARTANEQAVKLLDNRKIAAYIEEQLERIHNEQIADTQEVLEYLTSVMRGEKTEQVLRFVGDGVQEVIEIEVSAKDRIKCAELIGKRYGIFRKDVSIELEPVVIVDDLKQ
ncbi:MAG: terminase small subunit [Oscillospiraceae bacterium]|nr:terminase small subunit [Oscillospiraceae bacterium]